MQRLLLVEDDPALQFTIQTALEANGYRVEAVSTTGDAIERLADEAYPIVVTISISTSGPGSTCWMPPSARTRCVR
jgi:CheY-like chemotaxis protein